MLIVTFNIGRAVNLRSYSASSKVPEEINTVLTTRFDRQDFEYVAIIGYDYLSLRGYIIS